MNLLFIAGNRLGDAVLATGALAHLIAGHPGLRVSIACGPVPAPLFAEVPGLDRVLAMPKRRRGLHWLRLWSQTVRTVWDIVVDLRGSALAWFLPARRRIVWRGQGGAGHQVERLGRLIGLTPPPAPHLWISAAARVRAAARIPSSEVFLALAPTANFRGKMWPADRFADLALRLTDADGPLAGAGIIIYGAPGERELAAPVIARLPPERTIDRVGQLDLLDIAADLERCRLFIGNDSGLTHLAAAVGVATLGLYGPSPIPRYRPWGTHTAVVATEIAYPRHFEMLKADPACVDHLMDSLSVDAAQRDAVALLARTAAPA